MKKSFKKLSFKQRHSLKKYGQFKYKRNGVVWTYIVIKEN